MEGRELILQAQREERSSKSKGRGVRAWIKSAAAPSERSNFDSKHTAVLAHHPQRWDASTPPHHEQQSSPSTLPINRCSCFKRPLRPQSPSQPCHCTCPPLTFLEALDRVLGTRAARWSLRPCVSPPIASSPSPRISRPFDSSSMMPSSSRSDKGGPSASSSCSSACVNHHVCVYCVCEYFVCV